jgi:hypothetical protein
MTSDESAGSAPVCEICFEEIPPGDPVVRAAQQLDVSFKNPRAGKIDGRVVVCDERCWRTLQVSGNYRRLDPD